MPVAPIRPLPPGGGLAEGLEAIRRELEVPGAFPSAATEEAAAAAAAPPPAPGPGRVDRRDLPLVTVDPAGSRDLDQALAIARDGAGGGFRVSYAIADVAARVPPGGAVDAEARRRGVTVYLPDARSPLHPPPIGEDASSLLPGRDRPALLWSIALDPDGEPVAATLERAVVRSRRALAYPEAQAEADAGEGDLGLLAEVGRLRLRRETERGGVSLSVPAQEVVRGDGGAYSLRYEAPLPVEDWNAQVSLLAGICAARIMIHGGIGLFRVLPPAEPEAVAALRRSALALGVAWPEGARYGDVVRALDPRRPRDAAFAVRAARLFRGAGYAPWRRDRDGEPPLHAAIAAAYAHVTAPLRRLADRFANEIVLALCAGREPEAWATDGLDEAASATAAGGRRQGAAERAAVDLVEATLLAPRVGEEFTATVLEARGDRATVQLADPAVVGPLDDPGSARAGRRIGVRLVEADPASRRVRFTPAARG